MNINNITALFLLASSLSGCSEGVVNNYNDVYVRLNAGLQMVTKGAINEGNTFSAAIAGWESSENQDYTNAQAWLLTTNIVASESLSEIVLNPQPYYNQNSEINTHIMSWYPSGTLENGVVSFAEAPNGTTDVLLSDEVVGSAINNSAKSLIFNHILTQLKFCIVCDAASNSTTTIKSITIKEAELPTGINIGAKEAIYAPKTSLVVPNINGSQPITTTVTPVGVAVMLKPFAGKSFKVDIETSTISYTDVIITIDNDLNLIAGKAYTITVTFSDGNTQVKAFASVAPWTSGTGSADIPTI